MGVGVTYVRTPICHFDVAGGIIPSMDKLVVAFMTGNPQKTTKNPMTHWHHRWGKFQGGLKGSLPKGSFDRRVRIGLLVPWPVPTTPPPPLSTPSSLLFPQATWTRPQTPPSGAPIGTRTPLRNRPPGKNYPLVSARPPITSARTISEGLSGT